jgi:hypothetical protein
MFDPVVAKEAESRLIEIKDPVPSYTNCPSV